MLRTNHFSREFDAAITQDMLGRPDYIFSAPGAGARVAGIAVEPWGADTWTATFAAPDPGCRALSVLAGTPSPTRLCVVERGTAFIGDVFEPEGFAVVRVGGPVVAIEELVREDLLLLVTPWTITGVGVHEASWTTPRIAINGLRVDEAGDGWIRGVADPDDDEPRNFAVNLQNGKVVGGAGLD